MTYYIHIDYITKHYYYSDKPLMLYYTYANAVNIVFA